LYWENRSVEDEEGLLETGGQDGTANYGWIKWLFGTALLVLLWQEYTQIIDDDNVLFFKTSQLRKVQSIRSG